MSKWPRSREVGEDGALVPRAAERTPMVCSECGQGAYVVAHNNITCTTCGHEIGWSDIEGPAQVDAATGVVVVARDDDDDDESAQGPVCAACGDDAAWCLSDDARHGIVGED